MKVLVTGGAGFIGTNLTRHLIDRDISVTVFDNLSSGLGSNIDSRARFVPGDVRSPVEIDKAVQEVDCVVHLAARGSVPRSIQFPRDTHNVNASGTLNVLEAARERGCPVIFSSSSSVYGANDSLPKSEDSWVRPLSPYAASKLAAEGYCSAYAESFGLPVTIFRFFNVFGPYQRADHDYAAVLPRWIQSTLTGHPVLIHGTGTQTRDFTYVDDVISIIASAIDSPVASSGPINLAFGENISLIELHAELEAVIGRPIKVTHGPQRESDVSHSQNDPSILRKNFPLAAATPLREALESTVDWMRQTSDPFSVQDGPH